jgi:ribonuclease HI
VVFTDGGFCYETQAAVSVAVFDNGKELTGIHERSTSQRAELLAALLALESLTEPHCVEIVSDSTYLTRGAAQWLPRWVRTGWRGKGRRRIANVDLWKRLYRCATFHDVTWRWVRGHHTHAGNCRADALCTQLLKARRAA